MDNKGIGAVSGKEDDVKRGKKLDAVRIRPYQAHFEAFQPQYPAHTAPLWPLTVVLPHPVCMLPDCYRVTGRDRTAWLSPPPTHRTPRRRSAGEQEQTYLEFMLKKAR
jgi:hypothetical protein